MELVKKHFEELTLWELHDLMKVRSDVFIIEQQCVYPDIDGLDTEAMHLFYRDDNGHIVAYLRVLDRGARFEEVSLGRILTVRRGEGLGLKIVQEGIRTAREEYGADRIRIAAQQYAQGFYERLGIRQVSAPFMDDGIAHILMLLELA